MKKLLDETTDDLTRSLLEAGRSQRPPAANQAKLLVAMGAGAGVGLFSSKAFAWLSSSAGKLTLLGVSLGIAGSVWVALPSAQADRVEARLTPVSPAAPVSSLAPVSSVPNSASVPAPVAVAPSDPTGSSPAGPRVANAVPVHHVLAPVASERRRRAAGERKRAATRRGVATQRGERSGERNSEGPLPAASAPLPAVAAPSLETASLAAAPPAATELDAREPRASGLETEIQLVDAMRGAAQRNDTPALRRLVDSYRGTFPEGQLRQEVSELALRTLSAAH